MSVRKPSEWRPDWRVHPGESVREARTEAGLSQRAAADRMGIAFSYLSDIERGRRGVSPLMALRLERMGWGTAELWARLQAGYDVAVLRLAERGAGE